MKKKYEKDEQEFAQYSFIRARAEAHMARSDYEASDSVFFSVNNT